jgi:putative SOS response-associated peptidase YedK
MREQFGIEPHEWQDRYNIAPDQGSPTRGAPQPVPIIRCGEHGREVALAQWWLLPYWSKARFITYSTFNARIETVEKAAAFREPFRHRRCIVPASGFFEWQPVAGRKQPWFMRPAQGDFLGFAGLWDRWHQGDVAVLSCTVLVGDPDEDGADIHDRAPIILAPELYDAWLDPSNQDPAQLMALLHANPGVPIARHPVAPP